jgi:hypothetical protein
MTMTNDNYKHTSHITAYAQALAPLRAAHRMYFVHTSLALADATGIGNKQILRTK